MNTQEKSEIYKKQKKKDRKIYWAYKVKSRKVLKKILACELNHYNILHYVKYTLWAKIVLTHCKRIFSLSKLRVLDLRWRLRRIPEEVETRVIFEETILMIPRDINTHV